MRDGGPNCAAALQKRQHIRWKAGGRYRNAAAASPPRIGPRTNWLVAPARLYSRPPLEIKALSWGSAKRGGMEQETTSEGGRRGSRGLNGDDTRERPPTEPPAGGALLVSPRKTNWKGCTHLGGKEARMKLRPPLRLFPLLRSTRRKAQESTRRKMNVHSLLVADLYGIPA